MSDKSTVSVDVMTLSDGSRVGKIEMSKDEWDRYAEQTHAAFQWPAGSAKAGDVLTEDQIEEMGIDAATAIFLE